MGSADTQHLEIGLQRIHQRAELVEHRAHPQAAAQGCQPHQSGMPARCEQEGDAGRRQGFNHPLRWSLQVEAGGLQHVGGADTAAGTAVAVLGHVGAAGRRHKRHRRGDVEGVGSIATGATGVDQRQIGAWTGQGAGLTQHPGHGGKGLAVGLAHAQSGQQCAGEHRFDRLVQPAAHQLLGLRSLQWAVLEQLLQQGRPGGGGSHRRRGNGVAVEGAEARGGLGAAQGLS